MCECLICDWDELLGRELTHRVTLRAPWRGDYTTLDGQDIGFLIVEVIAELFVEGIRDRCEYFLEVRFLLHNMRLSIIIYSVVVCLVYEHSTA